MALEPLPEPKTTTRFVQIKVVHNPHRGTMVDIYAPEFKPDELAMVLRSMVGEMQPRPSVTWWEVPFESAPVPERSETP